MPKTTNQMPITKKNLLCQKELVLFKDSYTHTANASKEYILQNPNIYAIDCLITAQAGAGDYQSGVYYPSGTEEKEYGGRHGTNIKIYVNDTLKYTLTGGYPNIGRTTATRRSWKNNRSQTKYSAWEYKARIRCMTSGENISFIATIKPKGSIKLVYEHKGATNATFKGSHTISGLA